MWNLIFCNHFTNRLSPHTLQNLRKYWIRFLVLFLFIFLVALKSKYVSFLFYHDFLSSIVPRDAYWAQKPKVFSMRNKPSMHLVWITRNHIVHTRKVFYGYLDEQSAWLYALGYMDFTLRCKECQQIRIIQRMSRYGFSSVKSWRALGYCRPTLRYKSTVKPRVRVRDRVVSYFFWIYNLRNVSLLGEYHLSVNIFPRVMGGGGWYAWRSVEPRVRVRDRVRDMLRVIAGCLWIYTLHLEKRILTRGIPLVSECSFP